ncbi:MAG: acylneuraminate cytidylyltransferase [Ignavibacteriae bacterium HGW-Ignavibacteriae-2]|jgi:YrbI family 3-deoxy-D-manno-octulosonate 8-phosphate phosphatase|nr:HAD hydrolase family protein [Bacteroidota bacterium]PKL88392.1 MAG: acylneuraminate cytidylyltransferase [Ignavibacteriae bacterium HGW-Ignavibacteriae-2]
MNKELSYLKNIKLIITDVDGVLTDGSLYYSRDNLELKRFNIKDGMGAILLREAGIKCGIITTDKPDFVKIRAERMKLDFYYTEVWDKASKLDEICSEYGISRNDIAFIGDDINDIGIIKEVGFTAAPADAVDKVLKLVDYICKRNGGHGAFRELVDLILESREI